MAKPKTPEHLQRCEDAAAKLLQGKKKVSHADVLRTFRLIKAAVCVEIKFRAPHAIDAILLTG